MYFIVKRGEACRSRLMSPPFTPIDDENSPISGLGKWTMGGNDARGLSFWGWVTKSIQHPFLFGKQSPQILIDDTVSLQR